MASLAQVKARELANGLAPISNAQNRRMLATRFPELKAAKFDLQYTTPENQQLWALSDLLSVDSQANFMVRRQLRMRCRYVYHNNPYAIGPCRRLANYVIGSGPTLHLSLQDKKINDAVNTAFNRWAIRVQLARKLRTSRAARFYNGEGFNLLRTNPKLKCPVKLDLFEIEADQVTSPLFGIFPSQYPDQLFDGLILDPWGNKEIFHVLRQHPGAFGAFLIMGYEFDPWPAEYVIHDYARLRPFQQRGIPEMTPAADLFEERRRYRKSVLAAAETASDYAGFAKTMGPPVQGADSPEADTGWGEEMDYAPIRRRQIGVLPEGYDVFQMKAEQPTTTYDGYDKSLCIEMSQVLDMPLFIFTGDARDANMSSAYIASQGFDKAVDTDRQEYDFLMDQILDEFLKEARRIPGLIPRDCPDDPDHSWRWPRNTAHADPQKMAMAQNQRLKNGRSPTLEASDEGEDWEENCEAAANAWGVPIAEYKASVFQSVYAVRGNPPPASLPPDTGDQPDDIEEN